MRRFLSYFLIAAALFVVCISCRNKDSQPNFIVECSSDFEGEDIIAHLTFEDYVGDLSINCFVSYYDAMSGRVGERVEDLSFCGPDGGEITFPYSFPSPKSGKYDLYIGGLSAGTYHLSISAKMDKFAFIRTAVVVVKSTGEEIEPTPGPITYEVDDFTIPVVEGMESLTMRVGEEMTFVPTILPIGIGEVIFEASSSEPDVVLADGGSNSFTLSAISVGTAIVEVWVENIDGPTKSFLVNVISESTTVEDFTVPDVDKLTGYIEMESGHDFSFTPTVKPAGIGEVEFSIISSNPDVAYGECVNGVIVIHPKKPGLCSITIGVANSSGPTKTIPILVFKNVVVTVDFYELETSEEQIQQKTFPCYLRFSSDSDYPFDNPIAYTISSSATVLATGYDAKFCSDKSEVKFYGNKKQYYNITDKILLPASNLLPVVDYSLKVSLSLEKYDAFDSRIWRVTYNDIYRTQTGVRIKQYLTLN